MKLKREMAAMAIAVGMLVGSSTSVVASGFPVVDLANLTQNLMTVIRTAEEVQNSLIQIRTLDEQLSAQLQSLQSLDPSAFDRLHALMNDRYRYIEGLVNSVQGIGYTVDEVGYEHDALFPMDTEWEDIPTREYEDYYRQWNQELSDAARTAMQAQGSLVNLQNNNDEVVRILSAAEGADGEVRQLQAQNQVLAVISGQLNEAVANLAVSGRVAATAAAVNASSRESKRQASRTLMEGFNDRGAALSIPDQLPRIPGSR